MSWEPADDEEPGDAELIASAISGRNPSKRGWIRANCPMCPYRINKTDRKRSFGFHVKSHRFECYRCGANGRLKNAPDDWDELELDEEAARAPIIAPPAHFYELASESGQRSMCLEPARQYVAGRGLGPQLIAESRIGACPAGNMAGRVVVPVLSPDGAWLWYVGRAWVKQCEKPYLYPSGGRSGVMFNHAALHLETDVPVLIVEGCFDALAYWPDAVAVLGKPTEENLEALIDARRPVAVVLDGDAHEEGWALMMKLRLAGQRAGTIKLGPRVDPDEVPRDVLRDAARRSIDEGEVEV